MSTTVDKISEAIKNGARTTVEISQITGIDQTVVQLTVERKKLLVKNLFKNQACGSCNTCPSACHSTT